MLPSCCENVSGVDFESNKVSAREGFLGFVLRVNYFSGALYYAGSCRWEDSLLWDMLHQSEKLEVPEGAGILNIAHAGEMC